MDRTIDLTLRLRDSELQRIQLVREVQKLEAELKRRNQWIAELEHQLAFEKAKR